MASTEEYARLIVEAQAKGFAEVEAKIKSNEAALDDLKAGYQAGKVTLEDYLASGAKLQSSLDGLQSAYAAATKMAYEQSDAGKAAAQAAKDAAAQAQAQAAQVAQAAAQAKAAAQAQAAQAKIDAAQASAQAAQVIADAKAKAAAQVAAAVQAAAAAKAQAAAQAAAATQAAADAKTAAAAQAAAAAQVQAAAKATAQAQAQAAAQAAAAAKASAQAQAAAAAQVAAAAKAATKAQEEDAARTASVSRQRTTALGYSLNDFFSVSGGIDQRLNAIANNLPMLLAGFGGVGLALSGIVPIIGMVIKNWESIAEAFGITTAKAGDYVDKLKERIKTLEDKKVKVGVDLIELDSMREKLEAVETSIAAIEKFRKNQSHYEKESGSEVSKLLEDAKDDRGQDIGGKDIESRVRANMVKEEEARNEPLLEARRRQQAALSTMADVKAGRYGTGPGAANAQQRAETELAAAQEAARNAYVEIVKKKGIVAKQLGDLLDKAQKGDAIAQNKLAEQLDAAGLHTLGEGIRTSTADRLKERDKTEQLDERTLAQVARTAEQNKVRKDLTDQGRANEAEMLKGLADEARQGIAKGGVGEQLKQILVNNRAADVGGTAEEFNVLTSKIATEMGKLVPALASFPETFDNVAQEIARTATISVEDTIKELQDAEQLTRNEALRRLDQMQKEKQQGKGERTALDEFTEAAGKQYRQDQQTNRFLPQLTPEMQAALGKELQDKIKATGATPGQQRDIGLLMNDPRASRAIPGAMAALQKGGLSEAEATRALPDVFHRVKDNRVDINQAAQQIARQRQAAARNAQQEAIREQTRLRDNIGGVQDAGVGAIPKGPMGRQGPPGKRRPGDQAANDVIGQVVATNGAMLEATAQTVGLGKQLAGMLAKQGVQAKNLTSVARQTADFAVAMGPTAQTSGKGV